MQDRRLKMCFALLASVLATTALSAQTVSKPDGDRAEEDGQLSVLEDPTKPQGRRISLHYRVLHARAADPRQDPVFILAGGPGQAATTLASGYRKSWMREKHDIVLVDQRGTGKSNALQVPPVGDPKDPQTWFRPVFEKAAFERALPRIQRHADPSCYTTMHAMDDLDLVRRKLGYEKINLVGGSYGTRAALIYLRRHGQHVRCAILNGVAPLAFRNPLYHARAAQDAFDLLSQEVAAKPEYRKAFGDLHERLRKILAGLEKAPAKVKLRRRAGGTLTLLLDRDAFAQSLRVMLYGLASNRAVPLRLLEAAKGDFRAFAMAAYSRNRGLRSMLSLGMTLSVVGSEDIPRIREEEIEALTKGTFLGSRRVRSEIEAARIWPTAEVPASYGEPVRSKVPVLLLSGTQDPVTPPRWGAEAARHLPNSLHLVVPGTHGVGGPCLTRIQQDFLEKGTVRGLDTSGIRALKMPPLVLPKRPPKATRRRRIVSSSSRRPPLDLSRSAKTRVSSLKEPSECPQR